MKACTVGRFYTLLAFALCGVRVEAQTGSSPEAVIDLNEGIYEYLQGSLPGEESESSLHYQEAIKRLSAVCDKEPQNTVARMFRALSYGQMALIEHQASETARVDRMLLLEIPQLRTDETRRQEAEQKRADLAQRLRDSQIPESEKLILKEEWNYLDATLRTLKAREGQPTAEIEEEIRQLDSRTREAAEREQGDYQYMLADARFLVESLREPEAVVTLLEVIALTKIDRFDESRALEIKERRGGGAPPGMSAERLRRDAAVNLEHAARLLKAYLATDPTGPEAVRCKFFLGVIRFRQAVPLRAEGETPEHNARRLGESDTLMTELADADQVEQKWRSYAEFYLGLIATERAKYENLPAARQDTIREARRHLDRAAELDTVRGEGEEWISASRRFIPDYIALQRPVLDELERAEPVPQFRNDFQLSVYSGAHRDTNVVLLGERTDLPRGISNPRDFGFTLATVLDYTADIGRWDRRLEGWTFAVQGRVYELWHVRIDEFDEQDYGGSAAIQYELLPKRGTFGPLYAGVQYDYDYTLLGRDAFVEIQAVTPNLRLYSFDGKAITDLRFTYSIRDYREPLYDRRFDRDGEYNRLGLVQSLKTIDLAEVYRSRGLEPWGLPGDDALGQDDPDHPARYLTPFVGFQYGWDATAGDEFDQKEYVLSFGAAVPLPYGLTFDATAQFEWQDYAHGSLIDFHRRGRNDLVQRYSVGLSRTFVLRGGLPANRYELAIDRMLMTIRADAAWTLDDSNVQDRLGQGIFEYDRVVYGLSVVFTFN